MAFDKKDHDGFKERLQAARAHKSDIQLDLQEAYFFTNPRLARQVLSQTKPSQTVEKDADTLATDIGAEVSVDFATEVINGFFPEHLNWAKSGAGEGVPDERFKAVEEDVRKRDDAIFRGIRASNFNSEIGTALVPDLSVGTVSLWVDEPNGFDPIHVQHHPIRETEINLGPDGRVDDRFIVRHLRGRQIPDILKGIDLPEKIRKKIGAKANEFYPVAWGHWRDWNVTEDFIWQAEITVCDEVVWRDRLEGEAACPHIVMRFLPHALQPWGNGPAIASLPNLRVLDALTMATQDRADQSVNPSIGYPDDGVVNFEQGIESGMAYPMRPGSGRDFVPLYFSGDADIGFYTLADIERRIRRQFYADYPQQRGDTPPTATQWVDEMVLSQRRIGTPGKKFFDEGPAAVFKRYEYLLEKRGRLDEFNIESDGKAIALVPNNPAAQAQEQLDVQIAVRLLEIAKGLMPETSAAAIDELRTIENIKKKLGDKIVELRDPNRVEQLVAGILQGAATAGAEQPGGEQ